MAKKKRHHYIPQFYLSRFLSDKETPKETPFLWVYGKDNKVPFRKSPRNIGFENYFYAYEDGDRVSFEIEDILSELESAVARLFKDILQFNFDFDDAKKRFVFGKFVSFMHYRTVRSREHFRMLSQNAIKKKFIEKINEEGGLTQYLRKHEKSWDAEEFIDSFNKMKIIPSKVLALEYMLQAVEKTIPSLCIRNWAFLYLTSPNCFFITSDSPVLLHDDDIKDINFMPGFLDERTDIVFPLSPNMCLYASFNVKEGFWPIPDATVRVLNRKLSTSCHRYFFSKTKIYECLF